MSQFNTERLQLRWPLTEPDPRHVEWLNDKELMRWSEQRYLGHDMLSQKVYLYEAYKSGNPIVFDIRLPPACNMPGFSIGTISAYIDRRHRRVDMGIMIGPDYHGQGYASEAWMGVMQALSKEFVVEKWEAGCNEWNGPMKAVLRRCGYSWEGTRTNHFRVDDKPCDLELFGRGPL